MAKSVDELLAEANLRLKVGRIGVTIRQKSNRLYLRATLPPKPGSNKTTWYQQDLAIRIDGSPSVMANPAGIRHAEAEAKKIGGQIATRLFEWEPYLKIAAPLASNSPSVKDEIRRFEEWYFSRRKRNNKTVLTYRTLYQTIFNKLPQDAPMSEEVLTGLFTSNKIPPDSSTRQKAVIALSALAKFLGVEGIDFKQYRGRYSGVKSVDPRDIPSDESIIQWRDLFPTENGRKYGAKAYQYVYSVLATYGLRPFEFFYIDWESIKKPPGVIIIQDSKSGQSREVYPCYPEWWEQWELYKPILPHFTIKHGETLNNNLGGKVSVAFERYGIPCEPYDLRHAWAIRTMKYGWPTSLSAKMMDHSEAIHERIYLRWIKSADYRRVFESLRDKNSNET